MSGSLAETLHRQRVESFMAEAETIRDWPKGPERTEEANMLIREAMYRCAIGRISYEEESRIFTILSFAMPADANIEF